MATEQEKAAAAARWLFDQDGVRGEYAGLKVRTYEGSGMRRAVWYPVRSHDWIARALSLDVDGTEETLPLQYLKWRRDLPEKTTVYTEGEFSPQRPLKMLSWVAVCPKGHEHELGPSPPAGEFPYDCPECRMSFEWEFERDED